MTSVSVIGLGNMGRELARTLVEAGHDVTVWNRTPDKAEPLVALGATLAEGPEAAIRASATTITCIRSHTDTRALLQAAKPALAGKTLIELSTGDTGEAQALMQELREAGADCLIGMISTFPNGIGQPDSAILVVGDEATWDKSAAILQALGGKSARIGDSPRALGAIYASLFLPRQGFMFGMIYGALICQRAGVSMDTYVAQLPLTLSVVHDYYDIFAATVPSGDFADPPASMGVYKAAFEDVLKTCKDLDAPDELPALLNRLIDKGVAAGFEADQITALTKVLG